MRLQSKNKIIPSSSLRRMIGPANTKSKLINEKGMTLRVGEP